MTELVTRQGEVVDTSPFIEQTNTYLRFSSSTPEDVWVAVTQKLLTSREALNWWIGDAILAGERRYGEKYSQELQETTSMSYSTLSNLVYVSRSIPMENRRGDLSWSHHAEVAGLDVEEQRRILAEAAPKSGETRARISRDQLRIQVRNQKRQKAIESGDAPAPVKVDELSYGEMRGMAEEKLQDYYESVDIDTGEVVEGEVVEEEGVCPRCHGSGRL